MKAKDIKNHADFCEELSKRVCDKVRETEFNLSQQEVSRMGRKRKKKGIKTENECFKNIHSCFQEVDKCERKFA